MKVNKILSLLLALVIIMSACGVAFGTNGTADDSGTSDTTDTPSTDSPTQSDDVTDSSTQQSSSSNSGSGIGIYIAKRMIVEAHKGTIAFESEYGKGTSFIITLPKIYKK